MKKVKDFIFKLYCLMSSIKLTLLDWYEDVWTQELDELVCCAGTRDCDCNCLGATHREQITWWYLRK